MSAMRMNVALSLAHALVGERYLLRRSMRCSPATISSKRNYVDSARGSMSSLACLVEHDLIRKPPYTFRDHASNPAGRMRETLKRSERTQHDVPRDLAADLHPMIGTKLWQNPCWLSFRANFIAH